VPTGANGKIAGRCRTLETVRIFYELDNQFMNVFGARNWDSVFQFAQRTAKRAKISATTRMAICDPSQIAIQLVRPKRAMFSRMGMNAFNGLMERLFDEVFSP
jgi:hypothetical protein